MAFHLYSVIPLTDYVLAAKLQRPRRPTLRAEPRVFVRWDLGHDGCPQSRWVRG